MSNSIRCFAILILFLAGCSSAAAKQAHSPADDASAIEECFAIAAGVSLVEITSLEHHDSRPACGNLELLIGIRTLQSTGATISQTGMILEQGGLSAPRGATQNPEPIVIWQPEDLEVGQQHWLAVAPEHSVALEVPTNVHGVIMAWPADHVEALSACAAAVESDLFLWQPQYDARYGITFEHKVLEKGQTWRIRVRKGEEQLWAEDLDGIRSERYGAWGIFGSRFATSSPGPLLTAETAKQLEADNEFGMEPGLYYVLESYELENGIGREAVISRMQQSSAVLLERMYDDSGVNILQNSYHWRRGSFFREEKSLTADGIEVIRNFKWSEDIEARIDGSPWVEISGD
ncbi:MAG: hypothetical protein AAF456_18905 [Planctomycetota bacterium]